MIPSFSFRILATASALAMVVSCAGNKPDADIADAANAGPTRKVAPATPASLQDASAARTPPVDDGLRFPELTLPSDRELRRTSPPPADDSSGVTVRPPVHRANE